MYNYGICYQLIWKDNMKVIFVGGVHGVGKTTACENAQRLYKFDLYSASKLLQEAPEYKTLLEHKSSNFFQKCQDIIVENFLNKTKATKSDVVIIDGHFSLFDSELRIISIDSHIFEILRVDHFICLYDDINEIEQRLQTRNIKLMSPQNIIDLQMSEIGNAKDVANKLARPLSMISAADIESFHRIIEKYVA